MLLLLLPFVSGVRAQDTESTTPTTDTGWSYTSTNEVKDVSNTVYTMTLTGTVSTMAAGTTNTDLPGLSVTFGATGNKEWTVGKLVVNNKQRGDLIYAQTSSQLALTNGLPTDGAFYVFKPAVSGKLTLTYSGWPGLPARWLEVNTNRNKVTPIDAPSAAFQEMTYSTFVIGGKTYYFYGNENGQGLQAFLNSVSFEPSFLKAGGKEQVLNNAILDAPTLGETVDMPFLSIDGSVEATYTKKEDSYSVNKTGDIVLIHATKTKIGAQCTIPTTTAFPNEETLAYYFKGINANNNAYVVDKGTKFTVGQALTTTNGGGGSMYLGGWQYGESGTANTWTSSDSKSKTDSWKQAVADYSGTDDQGLFTHTLDGFLYSTAGANDACSETRGTFDSNNKRLSLPCRGAYAMFEPERKGKLTVYILQNGSVNTFNDDKKATTPNDYGWTGKSKDFTGEIAWRPFYIKDEQGKDVPDVTPTVNNNLTWTLLELQDLQKAQEANHRDKKPQLYFYKVVNGERTEVTSGDEYTTMYNALNQSRKDGADIPIQVHKTTDGGYMVIQKSYVKYEFPVLPGKTYFIFSNTSKLGFCGYKFVADADQTAQTVSLANQSTSFNAPTGTLANVTLADRKFKAGQWTTLCLPFSVSASQMRSVFGDAVVLDEVQQVAQPGEQVTVDGQTSTMSRNTLVMVHHVYDQMAVAGVPYLIKPSHNVENATFTAVYFPSTAVTPQTVDCHHGYTWKGVFANEPMGAGDYYVGSKDGYFKYYTTDGHDSYSFRSYLDFDSGKAGAKRMVLGTAEFGIADVNTTTGISNMTAIEPSDIDPRALNTGKIYNLQGQVISNNSTDLNHLPAGIYIVNGKKELVK